MFSLVLFAYDPIAVWGLVVAIIGVVVGIVAAIAAIYAAYYAKKAPTADDLAKVVENTAHLEEVRTGISSLDARTRRQQAVDELRDRANGVSISVTGEAIVGEPLPVYLTTTDHTAHLVSVEFTREQGNVFGRSECKLTANSCEYLAQLLFADLQNWRIAGAPMNVGATRQGLRVHMHFDDDTRTVHRNMVVTLTSAMRVSPPGKSTSIYRLEGCV